MKLKKFILLISIITLFSGCISNKSNEIAETLSNHKTTQQTLTDTEYIQESLMSFYNEWKNVKYKFGGATKKGIDCSAFAQRLFKEKFNLDIPRTTTNQVKIGEKIDKSELEEGDLIFFKTSKIDRHVGIYVGDGRFMHASIKGVKLTSLDKPFYIKTYWTSRRVIF
ncbi:NlpC/P60 family protein [Halarcobacter ebronensis]|nr:NlpC/P60 family protein [Halarcobacter ebronensis]QKF80886.1 outer membrane lipoprotein, NlpC/P60 family [Halarcobacter ebronensis]